MAGLAHRLDQVGDQAGEQHLVAQPLFAHDEELFAVQINAGGPLRADRA